MLTIYDRPIIEYVVKEAIAGGITEIILITRTGKEAIENHFDAHYELEHRLIKKGKQKILGTVKDIIPNHVNITSIRQSDALGLGHAILCAKDIIKNEPFAVLLPDVLVLDSKIRDLNFSFVQLVDAWNETKIGQVMVQPVNSEIVENYGIAELGERNPKPFQSVSIKSLVEKPSLANAPSNLAVLGRYILPAKVLDLLAKTKPDVGGEIQLTDALDEMLKIDKLNALKTDAEIYDCGNKWGFLKANLAVAMRDPEVCKEINFFLMNKYDE
ncbi:sugar phosphate nucleotidyltransferase [Amylibacter sp.]|nr:sugar phosphate nucleotidyltransferase [Amylibacter sp.]